MKIINFSKIIFFIIFIFSVTLVSLSFTNFGLMIILNITQDIFHKSFYIQTVNGSLYHGISLEKVKIRNNHLNITIEHMLIKLNLAEILNQKLNIKVVQADNVKIMHAEFSSNSSSQQNYDFSWAKYINLQNIKINNVEYFNKKRHTKIMSINYTKSKNNNLCIYFPQGQIKGNIDISYYPILKWFINLEGRKIDLSNFIDEYGYVNFSFKTAGLWQKNNHLVTVKLTKLFGNIKNLPIIGYVDFDFNNGNFILKKSKISFLNSSISVNGSLDKRWNLSWQINSPSLHSFTSIVNGSFLTSGKINGEKNQPAITANFKADNIIMRSLTVKNLHGSINSENKNKIYFNAQANKIHYFHRSLPDINLKTKLTFFKNSIMGLTNVFFEKENKININFMLLNFDNLNAKINFEFQHLNKWCKSSVFKVGGSLSGLAKLNGNWRHPDVQGHVQYKNGSFTLNYPPMMMDSILLNADFYENKTANFHGQFKIGNGLARLNGNLDFKKNGSPFILTIEGKNLTLKNAHEYELIFSPKLNIMGSLNKKVDVGGNIFISKATIAPPDFSKIKTLPKEVTVVDSNRKSSALNIPIVGLNVHLNFKNIKLKYSNLDSLLEGSLNIRQSSDGLPVGIGALDIVKGHYIFNGRTLRIDKGS